MTADQTTTAPTARDIAEALYASESNVSKAAEMLGMSRTTFRRHRDALHEEVAQHLNELATADEPAADVEEVEVTDEPAADAEVAELVDAMRDAAKAEAAEIAEPVEPAPAAPAPQPAAPKPANPAARKRAVAEAAIRALAEVAATWEHDEISRDEATAMLSAWANYLPGGVWDERLGERSGAGRRK